MSADHDAGQRLYPTLRCRDTAAMMRWLIDAIGFREHFVHRGDGAIEHAELAFGGSILMLGPHRDDEYGAMVGDLAARRTDALYVAVDDVDALYARVAAAAGAVIEAPPRDTDYGSREFICRDPEGGLWSFGSYRPTP